MPRPRRAILVVVLGLLLGEVVTIGVALIQARSFYGETADFYSYIECDDGMYLGFTASSATTDKAPLSGSSR